MKVLLFISVLIYSSASLSKAPYTIKIPQEVIEAMDLSIELQARLGGGDIIGNGGGLAEQEFRFAFRRIPSAISSCLGSPVCSISSRDLLVLEKIKNIAARSIENKDRLIFLSESKYPGFFRDNGSGSIRIAKTAFIPGAPIFINLDMVYKERVAVVDFPLMISILVHELGHQAKVRSHSRLDELGSRMRDYLLQDSNEITQNVAGSEAKVKIYNLKEANKFSEVFFSYRGQIVSLKERIRKLLSCKSETSIPIGFEVSNIHWLRQTEVNRNTFVLPFKGWMKTYCLDLQTSAIWKVDGDIDARFQFYNEEGKVLYISSNVFIRNN